MIKLPVMDFNSIGPSSRVIPLQMSKVHEETQEVMAAINEAESKDRVLEECMDLIQSTVNLMYMFTDHQGVEQAAAMHFMKMKGRKYEIRHYLEVSKG